MDNLQSCLCHTVECPRSNELRLKRGRRIQKLHRACPVVANCARTFSTPRRFVATHAKEDGDDTVTVSPPRPFEGAGVVKRGAQCTRL